eukprot:PRCOL_00000961-RA
MEGIDAAQLAALQKKLSELGVSFVDTLPPAIRRRVRALRGLQAQRDELYEKFLEERAALEAKYAKLYDPLLTRRKEVVTGKAEPTDEEVEAGPESGSAAAAAAAAAEGVVVENNEDGDEKGIPDFWLQAMRHHEAIGPAITDNDAEVLEYVEDIKTGKLTGEEEEGFWLEFHFRDNPFFDNTVLRKEYVMIDEEEQLLDEARGTEIDWKKGKDVTTKLLKKKSKKGGPKGKVQTKREKVDSFFHFFNPPEMPEDESDLDEEEAEELQDHMETDYEMGLALRNKIGGAEQPPECKQQ